MDILNYFLQNPQAMQPQQNAQGMAPGMMGAPQGSTTQQSPIQMGSLAGMQAARQSIETDENQRRRAMGLALSHFGRNMSVVGNHGPGMAGNLSRLNQGLGNAIDAYSGEEARQQQINAALMERQEKQHKEAREWRNKLEQQKIDNAFERERLGILGSKASGKKGDSSDYIETASGKVDVSTYPVFEKPHQKNVNYKMVRENGKVLNKVKELRKKLNRVNELSEGDWFSPTGSVFGKAPNALKDVSSNLSYQHNPTDKKARLNRERANIINELRSGLEKMQPELETALLGGGKPGVQLIERFHRDKVYPTIEDAPDRLEYRLKEIEDMVSLNKRIGQESIRTNRQLDESAFVNPEEAEEDSLASPTQTNSPLSKMSPEELFALEAQLSGEQ